MLRPVAFDEERFSDPVALASIPGAVLVADRKTRSIYRIALDTGAIDTLGELDAAPTRLTPLNGGASWLIRERSQRGEPIFVLNGGSAVLMSC